jgi:hypothetical protein
MGLVEQRVLNPASSATTAPASATADDRPTEHFAADVTSPGKPPVLPSATIAQAKPGQDHLPTLAPAVDELIARRLVKQSLRRRPSSSSGW